jgi:AcrR family transcriptional regulator
MPPKNKFDKNDIIKLAFDYVRENGWEGLSARYLAQELNSSTMPIYSYIGSMKNLEEEVVKMSLSLFNEYLNSETTGDKWLDQAIGYVRFAMEEKMLFRAINDDKHASLQRKNTRKMWESLRKDLKDYELFKGMKEHEIDRIRQMRWFMIHGISTLINNEWMPADRIEKDKPLSHIPVTLVDLLRVCNQVIYEGLKDNHIINKLGIQIDEKGETESDG